MNTNELEKRPFKLTEENYHSVEANKAYMSVTKLKNFMECEELAMEVSEGRWHQAGTKTFLMGNYLHAWNENNLSNFKLRNPELFLTRKSKCGEVGDLKAEFSSINDTIRFMERDPFLMRSLSGNKEVIITAQMFGVWWKIKVDSHNPDGGWMTDLKFMKDLYESTYDVFTKERVSFVEAYNYHLQAAIYAQVDKIAFGREERLEFFIAGISKHSIPQKEVITIDEETINAQLNTVEAYMHHVRGLLEHKVQPTRCGKCAYCRSVKMIQKPIHYSELVG